MHTFVYKNIGADDGIKLQLGYGLCDPLTRITRLRCFESDSIQGNFVNYPCDTTYVITAVNEISPLENIEIYPNPSSGQINFKGITHDVDYWMYSAMGKLVQQGQLVNQSLFFDQTGVYYIKFKYDDLWAVRKVVMIK